MLVANLDANAWVEMMNGLYRETEAVEKENADTVLVREKVIVIEHCGRNQQKIYKATLQQFQTFAKQRKQVHIASITEIQNISLKLIKQLNAASRHSPDRCDQNEAQATTIRRTVFQLAQLEQHDYNAKQAQSGCIMRIFNSIVWHLFTKSKIADAKAFAKACTYDMVQAAQLRDERELYKLLAYGVNPMPPVRDYGNFTDTVLSALIKLPQRVGKPRATKQIVRDVLNAGAKPWMLCAPDDITTSPISQAIQHKEWAFLDILLAHMPTREADKKERFTVIDNELLVVLTSDIKDQKQIGHVHQTARRLMQAGARISLETSDLFQLQMPNINYPRQKPMPQVIQLLRKEAINLGPRRA